MDSLLLNFIIICQGCLVSVCLERIESPDEGIHKQFHHLTSADQNSYVLYVSGFPLTELVASRVETGTRTFRFRQYWTADNISFDTSCLPWGFFMVWLRYVPNIEVRRLGYRFFFFICSSDLIVLLG